MKIIIFKILIINFIFKSVLYSSEQEKLIKCIDQCQKSRSLKERISISLFGSSLFGQSSQTYNCHHECERDFWLAKYHFDDSTVESCEDFAFLNELRFRKELRFKFESLKRSAYSQNRDCASKAMQEAREDLAISELEGNRGPSYFALIHGLKHCIKISKNKSDQSDK